LKRIVLTALLLTAVSLYAKENIISIKSARNVSETVVRFEKDLTSKGLTEFLKVDHAANAKKIGESLRPTVLILFENPKVGTKIMQSDQRSGLHLPLKVLIFEDKKGVTWISYEKPKSMLKGYNTKKCKQLLKKLKSSLRILATEAAKP